MVGFEPVNVAMFGVGAKTTLLIVVESGVNDVASREGPEVKLVNFPNR